MFRNGKRVAYNGAFCTAAVSATFKLEGWERQVSKGFIFSYPILLLALQIKSKPWAIEFPHVSLGRKPLHPDGTLYYRYLHGSSSANTVLFSVAYIIGTDFILTMP